MEPIKLKKGKRMKYCINCREIVEIILKDLNGYCPNCGLKLFTLSRENVFENESKKI